MDERLPLRRHLYEQLRRPGLRGPGLRRRRALRAQIALLSSGPEHPGDDGSAGVREPRRPAPTQGPARAARG